MQTRSTDGASRARVGSAWLWRPWELFWSMAGAVPFRLKILGIALGMVLLLSLAIVVTLWFTLPSALLEAPPDENGEFLPQPAKGRGKGKGRGKQQPSGGAAAAGGNGAPARRQFADHREMLAHVKRLREEMMAAAKNLDFELAARIRDEVYRLERLDMELL